MKIEKETKPETCKVPSEGSGGTVDLRAKLLARRKAHSSQTNESGSASKNNEEQCVSKVLASGLNIGADDDDDDDDEDDEYMDIEDEDEDMEYNAQVGHWTT